MPLLGQEFSVVAEIRKISAQDRAVVSTVVQAYRPSRGKFHAKRRQVIKNVKRLRLRDSLRLRLT